MRFDRIMIAAPKSGSGKTIVTCALLQALFDMGKNVVSYKCGPDYIDPMFHESVLGIPSCNLDTFFTGEEETKKLFVRHAPVGGIAVLEGVMGLYDGVGGVEMEGSSYHLAKVTGTPVILVVDAKGMGRSLLPLLAGFLQYDTEHLVKGVILNRISKGFFETIKPLIEKELSLCVPGFLPEQEEFRVESRHLGLVKPDETAHIREKLSRASAKFCETVSISALLEIAAKAGGLRLEKDGKAIETKTPKNGPVIAVARDEAFCFYYADNLRMLEELGARLVCFSPIYDEKLPAGCQGLLLGGGYPELYAERLSKNTAMRTAVRQAVKRGMPIVAECGGFMYLHSALTDQDGKKYAMAGVIPGECSYAGRLVRFGYVELRERESIFLPEGGKIRGHEFHYYDSTDNGDGALAVKPATGRTYSCVMTGETYWMGFPHLYYPSNPAFARAFVEKAARYFCGLREDGMVQ